MTFSRCLFAVAAAVTAAAIADPIVERLSDAGFFGPGSFTDHSNADVIPALCAGALVALTFVALATMRAFGHDEAVVRLLRAPARQLDAIPLRQVLPAIFVLQLAVLFTMETCEQHLVLGRFLGGTVWLGAPIAVSLALHAAACATISFLLARGLRALASRVVVVVVSALRFILNLCPDARTLTVRCPLVDVARIFRPLVSRPTVRPPPLPVS